MNYQLARFRFNIHILFLYAKVNVELIRNFFLRNTLVAIIFFIEWVLGNLTVTTAGTNFTLPTGYRPLFAYVQGDLTFNTDGTVVSASTGLKYINVISGATSISGVGYTDSAVMIIKLYRDDNVYDADLIVDEFDLHYFKKRVG